MVVLGSPHPLAQHVWEQAGLGGCSGALACPGAEPHSGGAIPGHHGHHGERNREHGEVFEQELHPEDPHMRERGIEKKREKEKKRGRER